MSELKSCPLCGCNADSAIDGEYTIIQCQSCFCRTGGNLTGEMGYYWAKEEWNKRTTDTVTDEIAELREMLKSAKFAMEKVRNHHPLPEGHDCEMLRQNIVMAEKLLNK